MGTTATAVALSGAANAQEAARKACMAYVRGYENDRATVTEMREYAGCIDRLHQAPMTGDVLGVVKIIVLALFISAALGVVWERRNRTLSDGWVGAVVCGGFIGFAAGSCGLLALAGVWFGVRVLLA